jgi:hypothetical protein
MMNRVGSFLKRSIDIDDILVVLGMAGIFTGIWMMHRPAALIVTGLFSFVMGIMGSRMRRRHGKNS